MTTTNIDNLNVADDARIQGDATVKGNLRVEGWLDADNLRGVCKGLFATVEQLNDAYPRPAVGTWAMVYKAADNIQLYKADTGTWQLAQEHFPIQFDDNQFREALEALETEVSNRVSTDTAHDARISTIEDWHALVTEKNPHFYSNLSVTPQWGRVDLMFDARFLKYVADSKSGNIPILAATDGKGEAGTLKSNGTLDGSKWKEKARAGVMHADTAIAIRNLIENVRALKGLAPPKDDNGAVPTFDTLSNYVGTAPTDRSATKTELQQETSNREQAVSTLRKETADELAPVKATVKAINQWKSQITTFYNDDGTVNPDGDAYLFYKLNVEQREGAVGLQLKGWSIKYGGEAGFGEIKLPSAVPCSVNDSGVPVPGKAGVMSATQATQLRDVVANHATKTELANLRTYAEGNRVDIDSMNLHLTGVAGNVNTLMGEIGGKALKTDLQTEVSTRVEAVNNLWVAVNNISKAAEANRTKINAITPVLLKQAEYDALVAAGTVVEGQHYAIVEDEQEGEA